MNIKSSLFYRGRNYAFFNRDKFPKGLKLIPNPVSEWGKGFNFYVEIALFTSGKESISYVRGRSNVN